MNLFKRLFGVICLVLAPVIIFELVINARNNINPKKTDLISSPANWIVIIAIFIPITLGLFIFGWYAFRGEYDYLPKKSKEL